MIICFQCSPETKKTLDYLLDAGQYVDYSDVINMALKNLAILHNQISDTGVIFIEDKPSKKQHNRSNFDIARIDTVRRKNKSENIKENYIQSDLALTKLLLDIPEIFSFPKEREVPINYAKMPSDIWVADHDIPLDRWLFGQYNRLLPAKASCRALLNLTRKNPNGIDLASAASTIAKQATILGDYLTHLDNEKDIIREDAISTAFPTSGENVNKSQMRYANQFVASLNKRGQVSGLLVSLKLINLMGKNNRILLTKPGWEFSLLFNPILDKSDKPYSEKFSVEEKQFLISHITNNVPSEDFAYRTILKIIGEGINSPTQIDEALSQRIPLTENRSLSQSFLSSQRSGTISRMTDLGLLERERDGIRMFYKITEMGRKYLATTN
jgi:hypothetical protein